MVRGGSFLRSGGLVLGSFGIGLWLGVMIGGLAPEYPLVCGAIAILGILSIWFEAIGQKEPPKWTD